MRLLGLARWCGASLGAMLFAGCHLSSVVFAPEPEPEAASVPAAGREVPNEPPIEMLFPDEPVLRVVSGSVSCTGTLIYENQVLTAHHCVSKRDAAGNVIDDYVHTGLFITTLRDVPDPARNCDDWTNPGGGGVLGYAPATGIDWLVWSTAGCTTPERVYCFQQ